MRPEAESKECVKLRAWDLMGLGYTDAWVRLENWNKTSQGFRHVCRKVPLKSSYRHPDCTGEKMRHRLGRACPWQLTVTLGPTALVSKTCTWKHSGRQGRQGSGWGTGWRGQIQPPQEQLLSCLMPTQCFHRADFLSLRTTDV